MLFLLLDVHRVAPQSWRILLQAKLLTTEFSANGVVIIAGLLTDEKHRFNFLLFFATLFGHLKLSISPEIPEVTN